MRIQWSPGAETQKDDIWLFLADRSVAYADRVVQRIEQRVASLAHVPFQGPAIGLGRRRLSIPDIQYVVIYRIEDDLIRILRLWHTAQDRSE